MDVKRLNAMVHGRSLHRRRRRGPALSAIEQSMRGVLTLESPHPFARTVERLVSEFGS